MSFKLGSVVVTTGVTVLEKDGSLNLYNGFSGTILAANALLLVIGHADDELRVMNLDSGTLGRLNAGAVAEYK